MHPLSSLRLQLIWTDSCDNVITSKPRRCTSTESFLVAYVRLWLRTISKMTEYAIGDDIPCGCGRYCKWFIQTNVSSAAVEDNWHGQCASFYVHCAALLCTQWMWNQERVLCTASNHVQISRSVLLNMLSGKKRLPRLELSAGNPLIRTILSARARDRFVLDGTHCDGSFLNILPSNYIGTGKKMFTRGQL